jgi:hypothetical protein
MLRISLSGPPNRRKQPERYAPLNPEFYIMLSAAIHGGTRFLRNFEEYIDKRKILWYFLKDKFLEEL